MALIRDASEAQLAFQIEGSEADEFLVTRYRGSEGLCRLFRFEIELASERTNVTLDKIVGMKATLTVNTAAGPRTFGGIISRFEVTGEAADRTYYRAELVPAIWLLTHRYRSRIFQNKTIKEIITQVLTDAGIVADMFKIQVVDGEKREYCVQYRETEYNFICRLMEEEGYRWFFEQSETGHVLAIADPGVEYPPIPGETTLPYRPPAGLNVSEEHVRKYRLSLSVRPGAVELDDFNFETPQLSLRSAGDCGRDKGLQFHDYPGEFTTQAEGGRYASIRSEEFEAGRQVGVGVSNCGRLAPGQKFTLSEHPSDALNGEYLITSVVHQGTQSTERSATGSNGNGRLFDPSVLDGLRAAQRHEDTTIRRLAQAALQLADRLQAGDLTARREVTNWLYHGGQIARDLPSAAAALGGDPAAAVSIPNLMEDLVQTLMHVEASVHECRFECIPAATVYRPPRITPWPVIRGTQTARVVGPSGEEIHCDEYGRVKVQFNWDREGSFDDGSSCWIRASQSMAGGQYGAMFIPRVGQEVIVDFLEGDPDKPIITGRVFNADHMPPYTLPDEKTKSVIKTHSSPGGGGTNEIRFEDLKDEEQLLFNAQKDFHVRVGNQERRNVAENSYETIDGEVRTKIGGHRSTDIAGKDALHIADTRSVVVDGDVYQEYNANHDHVVASEYHINADKIIAESNSGITLKCGGNFITVSPAGIFIKGSLVGINSGGSALSSAISAQIASPAEPEDADEVEPGQDANYSGEPQEMPPIQPKVYEGHWIAVELKDKNGDPVAGEVYVIKTPGGQELRGTLDVNGYGRKFVEEEGECQISFPRLDSEEWDRA